MADDGNQFSSGGAATDSRRGFMSAGIGIMGAGMTAAVLGPALGTVAFPLQHDTTTGSDAFLPVGNISLFTGDEPVKVDLYSDKIDAWNRVVQVKVGSAWVVRHGGNLVALSTVCPHLGCGIDYDKAKGKFLCACHKTWFSTDGKVEEGPSPRAMDGLDIRADDKLVSIRYQRFKQGVEHKETI